MSTVEVPRPARITKLRVANYRALHSIHLRGLRKMDAESRIADHIEPTRCTSLSFAALRDALLEAVA